MIFAVTINESLAPISILVMIFSSLLVMPYRIILSNWRTKQKMTNYDDNDNWDLLRALYIIALGDKENSIKTINSLLKVNYSKDVKNFLIRLKETLENEE